MSKGIKTAAPYAASVDVTLLLRKMREMLNGLESALQNAPNIQVMWDEVETARRVLRARRLRERLLRADLFADPAWDMLLDLFVAEADGREVCVSSLCIAAAVPATTALRWIDTLESRGLIARRPDPYDKRRIMIDLRSEARQMIGASLRGFSGAA